MIKEAIKGVSKGIKKSVKQLIWIFSLIRVYLRTRIYGQKLLISRSDNRAYPDFCLKASTNTLLFTVFRRNPAYRAVLEHVNYKSGLMYLEQIELNYPKYLEDMPHFKRNDEWGEPYLFNYPKIGMISPTTLRYIKVYSDLFNLFGKPDNYKICEIGAGYGGQCRIIDSVSSPSSYTLVDIKPALMLSQRYLDNYILDAVASYQTMNELSVNTYDLLISNYAFTELPRDIQNVYLKKAILNSKKGYITYNEGSPEYFNSYNREDLLKIIPNSRVIEEIPLTGKGNCIIVWGDEGN